jgi:hypothetical protein
MTPLPSYPDRTLTALPSSRESAERSTRHRAGAEPVGREFRLSSLSKSSQRLGDCFLDLPPSISCSGPYSHASSMASSVIVSGSVPIRSRVSHSRARASPTLAAPTVASTISRQSSRETASLNVARYSRSMARRRRGGSAWRIYRDRALPITRFVHGFGLGVPVSTQIQTVLIVHDTEHR